MKIEYRGWTYNFRDMEMFETEEPERGYRTWNKLFPFHKNEYMLMQTNTSSSPYPAPPDVQEAWEKYLNHKVDQLLLE